MAYYQGDYYRGDPFLGAILGAAARGLGVGKLAAKAGSWALKRVGAGQLKRAAVGAATVGAIAAPVLMGRPSSGPMPINIGPIGIDPGAFLPGGRPLTTWGRKKYRRMNPLNPKALKRALRRAEGFEKFARRTVNALRAGPKKFKPQSKRRS